MASGKYQVIVAERADRMLLAHTAFLARVSPNSARKLLADFRTATKLISENPKKYPYADGIDVPDIPEEIYRKCLFFGRYKAIYLIEDATVYIDAVIDCRQENQDLY
jgi:plasmid stabilization system protein ParE